MGLASDVCFPRSRANVELCIQRPLYTYAGQSLFTSLLNGGAVVATYALGQCDEASQRVHSPRFPHGLVVQSRMRCSASQVFALTRALRLLRFESPVGMERQP